MTTRTEPAAVYLEGLFRNAFYDTRVSTIIVDVQGRVLAANNSACAVLGRTEDELRRLTVAEFTHPDDRQQSLRARRDLCSRASAELSEVKRYLRPDGSEVWVRVDAVRVEDVTGRLLYLVGHIEELTAARKMESQNSRQRQLLDAVHTVALAANAATTPAPVAAIAIEQICSVTGWVAGRLAQHASEGSWRSGDWHGPDAARLAAVAVEGPAWTAGSQRALVRTELAARGSETTGPLQLFSVPVLSQDQVVAVLEFATWDPAEPEPVVASALLSLASQLGHVLERERTTADLLASRSETQAVIAQAHDAFVEIDGHGVVTAWNAQAEVTFGWSAHQALGQPLEGLIVPVGLRPDFRKTIREVTEDPELMPAQPRRTVHHRDGHEFPVELTLSARRQRGGARLSAFVRDVSDIVIAEAEVARQRLFTEAALRSVTEGIAMCDEEGRLVTINDAMARRLGLSGRDNQPLDWLEDLVALKEDGQTPLPLEDLPLYRALLGQVVGPQTLVLSRPGGPSYRLRVEARPLEDVDGTRLGAVSTFSEIPDETAEAEEQARARRLDSLTGLANTWALEERLVRESGQAVPSQLLLIRVSDVRAVLNGSGTTAAEALVQEVARRLRATVREDDLLARTDIDEFAVLSQSGRHEDVLPLAQRVRTALELSSELAGGAGRLSVSIGAASSHHGTVDLLRDAAVALGAATGVGAGRIEVFQDVLREQLQHRLTLRADLQRALAAQEFDLRYQPQVDLASGRILSVEALVRWQHPTRGQIRPDEFIPLAEESGLILPLGRWVLDRAVAQLAAWRSAGHDELGVGVNVSAAQLDQQFVDDVREALRVHGVDARWLDLELTETTAVRQGSASLGVLTDLAGLGVTLSIDDFGTGYSMLGQLRALPFRRLKIDKSFVQESDQGHGAPLAVAMIAMAGALGLEVVGEGVETAAQLAFLRAEGCRTAQGYLFARPLLAEELTELLKAERPLPGFPAPAGTAPDRSGPDAMARLVRPLLEQLERVTGLESTYLTRVRAGQQEIVTARNSGDLAITEGSCLPWSESLCSRVLVDRPVALTDAPERFPECAAVTELGIRSYLGVPILDEGGAVVGTLCGASASAVPIGQDTLDTVAFYADMLAQRISQAGLEPAEGERSRAVQQEQQRHAMALAEAEARVREPLSVLSQWSSRLLDSGLDLPSQDRHDAIRALGGSAAEVTRYLDQLLDEARTEILRHVVRPKPMLLRHQLATSLQTVGLVDRRRLVLECDESLTVIADRLALERSVSDIAMVLLTGGTDDGELHVRVERVGDGVEVQFRQDGPGWSRDVDLFAPVRAEPASAAEEHALLGSLFLARTLVEATGGTVNARSYSSDQCTITVWLPVAT